MDETEEIFRSFVFFYRRVKQHMIPVLPRKKRKPMKRMVDRPAVENRMILKNVAVRPPSLSARCK